MNLKDRAIAAHKEQQEFEAEKEAMRFAKRAQVTEKAFQETFGEYLPVAPGTCDIVLAKDGLEIRTAFELRYAADETISFFQLRGKCPDCGVDCWSRSIRNLADLGKQIEDFERGWPYKCASAVHHPTVGETLLEAFQSYVDSIIEEVE